MTEFTYEVPTAGETRQNGEAKTSTAFTRLKEGLNGNLSQSNFQPNAALAGRWYEAKETATEQTRESTSFGNMATPDEITSVVLPSKGLIRVGYAALVKSSVSGAGRLGLFLGGNLVSEGNGLKETSTSGTTFHYVTMNSLSATGPFVILAEAASIATTGVAVATLDIFAAAGTYNLGVQYRATSGSITAKERRLWVEVHGS